MSGYTSGEVTLLFLVLSPLSVGGLHLKERLKLFPLEPSPLAADFLLKGFCYPGEQTGSHESFPFVKIPEKMKTNPHTLRSSLISWPALSINSFYRTSPGPELNIKQPIN